jgi:hypothetical protein
MKNFNKNTKTALILGGLIATSLVASPAFADNGKSSSRGDVKNQMQMNWLKDRDDDDHYDDKKIKNMGMDNAAAEKVRLAIESKNYTAFKDALTAINTKEIPTEAQFNLVVDAYTKAKAGDIVGAQKILKDNNLAPLLNRFIMGQHLELTDAQKTILKQAEELIKQGKTDEAKKLLETAGLPSMPMAPKDMKMPENAEKIKMAMETAKTLRSQGKTDEAKKVLTDAGLSEKSISKIDKEFAKQDQKERKSLVKIFKKFFKFGKED